ncbi:hypothetical protein ACOJBM_20440 [Rhizobium beringeri]
MVCSGRIYGRTVIWATIFRHDERGDFLLDGKPFRVAGVNNHYLTFGSSGEVTRVLDDATAMGANVVRTFLQPVIGSLDGRVPTIWNSKKHGRFQQSGNQGHLYDEFGSDNQPDGSQRRT